MEEGRKGGGGRLGSGENYSSIKTIKKVKQTKKSPCHDLEAGSSRKPANCCFTINFCYT